MREKNKDQVKLDEVLKLLFSVSDKVLIMMLNSLFGEKFDINNAKITYGNNEFITESIKLIRADMFINVKENEEKHHFHIEFQTLNDRKMVLRMFEYGFNKGKELDRIENEQVLYIPKQLVIFIEENRKIEDKLKMRIVFPDKQEIEYIVPVMKYWNYTEKDLLEQKMYPLLPLQVFKLRTKMEKIKRKEGENSPELHRLILEAKKIVKIVANEGKELYAKNEIDGEDFNKILVSINSLFEYLNRRYVDNEKLEKEVFDMLKTFYDLEVEKKVKMETARKLLKMGLKVKQVAYATELPINYVYKIKRDIE